MRALARHVAFLTDVPWHTGRALVSDFPAALTPDEVEGLLCAVGLNAVPTWMRPFHVLSTGEKYRALLARLLAHRLTEGRGEATLIDEFTSVLDRPAAKSTSVALMRALRSHRLANVCLFSCHFDIVPFLQPDWVLVLDAPGCPGRLEHNPQRDLALRRPKALVRVCGGTADREPLHNIPLAARQRFGRPVAVAVAAAASGLVLKRSVAVAVDVAVRHAARPFSDEKNAAMVTTGQSVTEIGNPTTYMHFPSTFGIGLVVGPSGSGKSQLLQLWHGDAADAAALVWVPGVAVAQHFTSTSVLNVVRFRSACLLTSVFFLLLFCHGSR